MKSGTRRLARVGEYLYGSEARRALKGGDRGQSSPAGSATVLEAPVLEQAFEELLTLGGVPPAKRRALTARLGWPDGRPGSLEEAGRLAGITRERMRQIQRKFEERVRGRVCVPVVERALAVIRGELPTTAEKVSEVLRQHRLCEGSVHPVALARIAAILGVKPGFEVVTLGSRGAVVLPAREASAVEALKRVGGVLRRAARPFGFVHLDMVRMLVGETLGDVALVEALLEAMGAVPLRAGWYYLKVDSREPAVRLIEDMLAVGGGTLRATEIAEGIRRRLRLRGVTGHYDQEGWYPSGEVVAAFCALRADRFRVREDTVSLTRAVDRKGRLAGAERAMVEVLLEAPGRVLRREDFEREVVARGVSANTFSVYTTYSPFIKEIGGGLWVVRGVEPDPLAVEYLRRRRMSRRRVEGWEWLADGRLRIRVRVGRVTGFVVGLPGAVRQYVRGRSFEALLVGGERQGRVHVGDDGASWGYGPALVRLGAREGDLVFVDFDLAGGKVTLSLARPRKGGPGTDE